MTSDTDVAVIKTKLDAHIKAYEKDYVLFKEKQDYHHQTNRKVHTEINLLSQKVDNMDSALKNNTEVCNELKGVCQHLQVTIDTVGALVKELIAERDTTKNNISTFAKIILWLIAVTGAIGGAIKYFKVGI
jgi:hypothetical protein